MKSYQAQRVEVRDTIRSGDAAYEAYESPARRESQEVRAQADQDVYGDSLDIPLNYGGMMDAVRDAVRANL